MIFSVSEENYIKSIYLLQQRQGVVTTNELASQLDTRPPSVTDMLKKLKAKNLLHYQRYQGFSLSEEGNALALSIIRKHRLWECFLMEKLQFGWDEVHEIAEELEHISSCALVEKLDAFLEYPKFDPHGDPIPDVHGNLEARNQVNLIDLEPDCEAEVSAVGSQSSELLELLKHNNIGIGTVLKVVRKFAFDNSLEIKINDVPPFLISRQLAQTLFLKPLYGAADIGSFSK